MRITGYVWLLGIALCATCSGADIKPPDLDAWKAAAGRNFIVYLEKRSLDPEPVARALDEFQAALSVEFALQPQSQKLVAVYVFATRAAFEGFLRRHGRPRSAAGWFHDGDGTSFIATSCITLTPDDGVWATLRHEATHLFIVTQVHSAKGLPEWINEGLAVWYSHAEVAEGRITKVSIVPSELYGAQGAIKVGAVERLRKHLARRNGEHWDRAKSLQSWSLIYWLNEGDKGVNREKIMSYVKSAGATKSPVDEFERVSGMKIEEAERKWKEYILGMGK